MPNIQQQYKNEIVPALMKEFNFSTVMRVPRIHKVVLNIGAGDAIETRKFSTVPRADHRENSAVHAVDR
jgi:large subunit ribosomal protein L5